MMNKNVMTFSSNLLNIHVYKAGVEINTGPLARGQWISCWASRNCFALVRLASKILKLYF